MFSSPRTQNENNIIAPSRRRKARGRKVPTHLEEIFEERRRKTRWGKVTTNLEEIIEERKNKRWQKAADRLEVAAGAANMGIVADAVSQWLSGLSAVVNSGPVAYFILITDPLIYFFHSLNRIVRLVGKNYFKAHFEEEENGKKLHPKQMLGDLAALAFFALAIVLFLGAIVAPPVGITLAWCSALSGLCFVRYFDYVWPEKQAKEKWEKLRDEQPAGAGELVEAEQKYLDLMNELKVLLEAAECEIKRLGVPLTSLQRQIEEAKQKVKELAGLKALPAQIEAAKQKVKQLKAQLEVQEKALSAPIKEAQEKYLALEQRLDAAEDNYLKLKKQGCASPEELEALQQEYLKLRKARQFYTALIFGLTMLLLCSSALTFAPEVLVPFLALAAKAASVWLVCVGLGRLYYYCKKKWGWGEKAKAQAEKDLTESNDATPGVGQKSVTMNINYLAQASGSSPQYEYENLLGSLPGSPWPSSRPPFPRGSKEETPLMEYAVRGGQLASSADGSPARVGLFSSSTRRGLSALRGRQIDQNNQPGGLAPASGNNSP